MSSKDSLRLQQTFIAYQQSRATTVYRVKVAQSAQKHFVEETEGHNRKELCNPCSRCALKQAQKTCGQCRSQMLCSECDGEVHGFGKFQAHHRNLLASEPKNFSQLSTLASELLNSDKQISISELMKESTKIAIFQTWQGIMTQVSNRFKTVIDSLKDKRKQIVQKIERKRQQEVKYLEDTYDQNSYMYAKAQQNKRDSIQNCFSNIKPTLNSEDLDRRYKPCFSALEEIQAILNKIQIRNVLVRVLEEVPTVKKPMKRSMFLSPCTSSAVSPSVKTPVHSKQLSQSTIQTEPFEIAHKISQEIKNKAFEAVKQNKLLSKVRSQKLFCKSPTNVTKYPKEKEKGTLKKGLKQGQ